jgi:hypothetical protein
MAWCVLASAVLITACGGDSGSAESEPPTDVTEDVTADAEEDGSGEPDAAEDVETESWEAAQDLCAERFEELGYGVDRVDWGGGVNVLGTLRGPRSRTKRP